jgi:EAL domain-containing protein (putative c-di-GMP-specific phosphodiesterase class I)/GGDEF domain-containing protein
MNIIVKRYLFRASIVASLALVLGLSLSALVYSSSQKVKENAVELVEQRIPILTSVNQLISDLSEQERNIYEYYRSQNGDAFEEVHKNIQLDFTSHSQILHQQKYLSEEYKIITDKQAYISMLSEKFHYVMETGDSWEDQTWNDLRALLTEISTARRELLPTLLKVEKVTKQAVEQAHHATLAQMDFTHRIVTFYGIAIVFLAGLIAWYIRQYILTNAKNTRLALFTHRNPNPILSVNNLGELVFSNPACNTLLLSQGLHVKDIGKLLPSNFMDVRQRLTECDSSAMSLEQTLGDRILHMSIHWLKELDAYDIHLLDVTEQKLAEQKVKHLAFYQPLTNLPNQYKLNEDIDFHLENNNHFSLGIFVVSGFKELVSSVGVEATSLLVTTLAKNIISQLESGVNLYQLNDSQFALISQQKVSEATLENLTYSILQVAQRSIVTSYGEFFIELDFGYCLSPEHSVERGCLLKNAHAALAEASKNEHQHFSMFDIRYAQKIEHSANLIDKLRKVLDKEELFLVFQPQLHLTSKKITGIETLVRWKHGGEIISPVDFIPLAEQSGLIVPIGEWILNQACMLAKKLVDLGHVDIVVAVNVSPRQFSHPSFSASVHQALSHSGLSPRNLELEITEGVFMHNEAATLEVLHELKSSGISLSIDDFGTGYSSLSYLKRLPIDKLKIDQSFIRDCHNNEEDRVIIRTIVELGKSLGLSLIAEGVEEAVHVEFLQKLNCDEIQGYWYSRPIQEKQLLEFIKKASAEALTSESI